MSVSIDIADLDALVTRVNAGDSGAALGLMRAVRCNELSHSSEVRVVDALYASRRSFRSTRLQFALAMMCARTGARSRGRAILLELVALEYPPAMHCLGLDLVEAGRAEAGLQLLRLARDIRLPTVRRGLLALSGPACEMAEARIPAAAHGPCAAPAPSSGHRIRDGTRHRLLASGVGSHRSDGGMQCVQGPRRGGHRDDAPPSVRFGPGDRPAFVRRCGR